MPIQEGSQNIPQQAFTQWNDPKGTKLIAQQRDGSLYCQSVQFANGSVLNNSTSISPLAHGAKWDGVTDDTAAIQATINAAYAGGGYVQLPPGVALVASTLNILSSVKIQGSGNFGPNGSYLKYAGTGTALQIGNPTGSPEVFAVILQDFGIYSTQSASKGIACYNLSEGLLEHVTVGGLPSSKFVTGIYFSQSGDIEVAHPVVSYNGVGIWLDSYNNQTNAPNYQIRVHDGSLYAHSEAAFKINAADGVFIVYNFIESCQYGVEFNDSGNNGNPTPTVQLVSCEHIVIEGNRWLLDDPPSGTYAVRNPVYLNGVANKLFTILHAVFENNNVFVAAGVSSPAVAYPIQLALSASTSASSQAWVDLVRNTVHGQTAGLYETNNSKMQVALLDNRLILNTGVENTLETDSISGITAMSAKARAGTFAVGNNNFNSGVTAAIQDNTETVGATTLLIAAGPGQSTTPLLEVQDDNSDVLFSSSFSTASTASAGAEILPAAPAGFLVFQIGATTYKLPYYPA